MNTKSGLQRTFIAVPLPRQIAETILDQTSSLRQSSQRIKWELPSKWHCTLKFLGETTHDQLETVSAKLAETLSAVKAFECSLSTCGVFFMRRDPRIVWIGLQPEEPLKKLAESVERLARSAGFPRSDKPFKAHCTIGRIRKSLEDVEIETLLGAVKSINFNDIRFVCSSVVLYQSTLHPYGSEYSELATITLQ